MHSSVWKWKLSQEALHQPHLINYEHPFRSRQQQVNSSLPLRNVPPIPLYCTLHIYIHSSTHPQSTLEPPNNMHTCLRHTHFHINSISHPPSSNFTCEMPNKPLTHPSHPVIYYHTHSPHIDNQALSTLQDTPSLTFLNKPTCFQF